MVVVIEQVVRRRDQSLKRIGGSVQDHIGTKLDLLVLQCAQAGTSIQSSL